MTDGNTVSTHGHLDDSSHRVAVLTYIGEMAEELSHLAAKINCQTLSEEIKGVAFEARQLID